MIKAIIFDVGGTLVKTDKAVIGAIELALKKNGLKLNDKEKVINALSRSTHFNIVVAVETSYCGSDIEQKISDCWESFNKIFPRKVGADFRVFPGVTNTLKLLIKKGIKLVIFTGFDKRETKFILKKLNLLKYFDFAITKDDVKKVRPDPEALLLAMKKIGFKKNECIYVGDTVADIQMAKNAKIRVTCVSTGAQNNDTLRKEKPDYFINNISEIKKALLKELPK